MAEGQKSHARIGFALVCGLALCCAVMYVTADGAESVLADGGIEMNDGSKSWKYQNILHEDQHSEMEGNTDVKAVKGLRSANIAVATGTGHEEKVESWDVKKVGTIITDDTPDGRKTLLSYFKKVERQIATEVAGRKTDIANIRTKMEKNREYNAKARSTMKKALLAKMAVNAKKAKDDLATQMRITAEKFHKSSVLENQRWKANIKRNKETRKIMRKNKRENKHALHMAVVNQQRALAALDAKTNAKIKKTNSNIAANAAQIKTNALKARKDLDDAMDSFDKKMFDINKEAASGRSRLATLAKTMDKKFRAHITLKIKGATAYAAKEFQDVRTKMAKNRHEADMALATETTRFKAALASAGALQNKRFKQTVADIQAAKDEADKQVKEMEQGFKMAIFQLTSVVKHDVAKLNSRVTDLQGVVTNNKLEQAKVNQNVNKEIENMIAVGNKRESKLASQDANLKGVMAANKKDTEKKMEHMAKEFYLQISKIRAQMKKDRSYQEHRLGKATGALFATLSKNVAEQNKKNEELTEATKQARIDSDNALREAKHSFANRLGALHETVVKNDKKANSKIQKLTGVVAANAMKDSRGRQLLKMQSKANKMELKNAIREAVAKGEKRARAVEGMAKKMNKKTQDALNSRITTEISGLSKKIHGDIETLNLQTKEARKAMKAEILYALRSEEELLKKQLGDTVKWSNKKFVALEATLAKEESTSGKGRDALKASIDLEKKQAIDAIQDAIAAQTRGLLALKTETAKKIKKTNKNVGAYGEQVVKHAAEVTKTMDANVKTLEDKISSAKRATMAQLNKADAASMARHEAALDAISAGLKEAKVVNDKKFGEVFKTLGEDRKRADENLASATIQLNDQLAKHAALEDTRFAKTVKDLKKAREAAWEGVKEARQFFTMGFADVTAQLKNAENRVQGEIQLVASVLEGDKVIQGRINNKVKAELSRVLTLSDTNTVMDKRGRARIGELMTKNKIIAKQEVMDLAKSSEKKVQKIRSYQAGLRQQAAKDLTEATEAVYEKMNQNQLEQTAELSKLTHTLSVAKATTAASLVSAKADFGTKYQLLVDSVASNYGKYESGLEELTGVVHNWKTSAGKDRKLIKEEAATMNADLNKAIVRAIQIGEVKAKEVLAHANSNIDTVQRALSQEIGEQVERMADTVLKTVHGSRSKIAQNYLSVKGYSGAAKDEISTMIQQGGLTRGALSSIGDFLYAVSEISDVKTKPAEGIAAGAGSLMSAFSGDIIPEVAEINKVNGLVDEYMGIYGQCRERWPYGLGRYLLEKLADAMTKDGVLTVGKKEGSSGQFVYMSGKAVGLSNRLGAFAKIGARVHKYQDALAQLSAKLPTKKVTLPVTVPPPEWEGN